MKRYLIIMEDGALLVADDATQDLFDACDDRLISLVDVTTSTSYYDGEWHQITEV